MDRGRGGGFDRGRGWVDRSVFERPLLEFSVYMTSSMISLSYFILVEIHIEITVNFAITVLAEVAGLAIADVAGSIMGAAPAGWIVAGAVGSIAEAEGPAGSIVEVAAAAADGSTADEAVGSTEVAVEVEVT